MEKIGLSALLFPHDVETFLNTSWPKQPFVTHKLESSGTTSVHALTTIPMLQSLDSLLSLWPSPIQVHLPDVRDESSSILTTALEAKSFYLKGMALLFNNVQTESAVLRQWLLSLSQELGLPRSTLARCMVYATPDGKGTAAHFDQNVNFILQIHGTKNWLIAPNKCVENPTQRHTVGQPMDPELASYLHGGSEMTMPKHAKKITLKPGSMLFVPRGFWHSTTAEGEALALNFTFSQPTWIDLFTAALRSRLLQSAEWRELADGINSKDPARQKLAHNYFDALLNELSFDVPNWTASEILAATEGVKDLN